VVEIQFHHQRERFQLPSLFDSSSALWFADSWEAPKTVGGKSPHKWGNYTHPLQWRSEDFLYIFTSLRFWLDICSLHVNLILFDTIWQFDLTRIGLSGLIVT